MRKYSILIQKWRFKFQPCTLSFKYPAWLDQNKSTLQSDVHENYSKQYKLVCEICSEYDKESETDPEELKKKRFDKLMELMQKVRNRQ